MYHVFLYFERCGVHSTVHTRTHTHTERIYTIHANQAFNVGSYKSENETQRFYLFFFFVSSFLDFSLVFNEKKKQERKKKCMLKHLLCSCILAADIRIISSIVLRPRFWSGMPNSLRFLSLFLVFSLALCLRNPPSSVSFDRRFLLFFFTLSKRLSRYAWYVRFARTYMYVAHDPCRLYFFPSKQ